MSYKNKRVKPEIISVSVQKKYDENLANYQVRVEDLKNQISKAKDELAQWRQRIEDANLNHVNRLQETQNEVDKIRIEIGTARQELNDAVALFHADVEKEKKIISDQKELITSLTASLASKQALADARMFEINTRLAEIEKESTDLDEKKTNLAQSVAMASKFIDEAEAVKADITNRTDILNKAAALADARIGEAGKREERARALETGARAAIDKFDAERDSFKILVDERLKFDELKKEYQTKLDGLKSAQEDLDQKRNELRVLEIALSNREKIINRREGVLKTAEQKVV